MFYRKKIPFFCVFSIFYLSFKFCLVKQSNGISFHLLRDLWDVVVDDDDDADDDDDGDNDNVVLGDDDFTF